ncbi:unnamed protein product, partial [Brassica rapa]
RNKKKKSDKAKASSFTKEPEPQLSVKEEPETQVHPEAEPEVKRTPEFR